MASPTSRRPLAAPGPELTTAQRQRYARHLLIPEVGTAGQRRLRGGKVAVVGAGGLGSPALLYLASAGVGTIGIIDDDVVELSNLQRQGVHGDADLGTAKTTSAAATVAAVNPEVEVVEHPVRLDSANAMEILGGYDVVLDGTDNFATRYLVNDVCVFLQIPHVWASILRFDGQVSVWWAEHGPCYRCVFGRPPDPGLVPSCAEAGVLGVLPASIGSVQATEVVKLLLGIGEPLVGRLLVHDALRQTWDTVPVARNPDCPVCGRDPTITEPADYEAFCRMSSAGGAGSAAGAVPTLGVQELARMLERRETGEAQAEPFVLVDVRGQDERDIAQIPGAVMLHLDEFESGAAQSRLPRDRPIVVHCHAGIRSALAVRQLLADGFTDVHNLEGGIHAWSLEVDPRVPTY